MLAAVTSSTDVAARLAAMEALDLIRRVSSSEEFTFKHALGRDALYASLLSGPRQALHLAIAREIESRNADRLSEVADTLAHHYVRADHKRKAVEYLALVGRKSLGIYSLEEAEHSLRTALTIARSEDSERMDREIATIMVDLAVVYYLQFRSAETITFIEPELLRINKLGDAEQVPICSISTASRSSRAAASAKQNAWRIRPSRSPSGWATPGPWRTLGPALS